MYTRWIGQGSAWLLARIVAGLAATGIHPNHLTLLGLVANIAAAVFFAAGEFGWGAAMIFLAGFLDIADGQVARKQGRVTAFGAFFDSTVDRYSDMVLYLGLLIFYAKIGRFLYVVLATVAMVGSFWRRWPWWGRSWSATRGPGRRTSSPPAKSDSWNGQSGWCCSSWEECSTGWRRCCGWLRC
jgi:phosphatidylglycerophosphate synthase